MGRCLPASNEGVALPSAGELDDLFLFAVEGADEDLGMRSESGKEECNGERQRGQHALRSCGVPVSAISWSAGAAGWAEGEEWSGARSMTLSF
eukprot:scaffold141631_cov35-Tisochrysis_lutea.AAC.2